MMYWSCWLLSLHGSNSVRDLLRLRNTIFLLLLLVSGRVVVFVVPFVEELRQDDEPFQGFPNEL